MSVKQLTDTIFDSVEHRENIDFVGNTSEVPELRIVDATGAQAFPNGNLQPMPARVIAILRDHIKATDRSLSYPPYFQNTVFPKEPFVKADGIRSAAALFDASVLLSSTTSDIARYAPNIVPFLHDRPDPIQLDETSIVDVTLGKGLTTEAGFLEYRAFGFIGNMEAHACVIGSRVDSTELGNNRVLACELYTLLVIFQHIHLVEDEVIAILNITNTHARILQAAVVDRPDGGLGFLIGIRYNHALAEAPEREWANMLAWGMWSVEEEDSDDEKETGQGGSNAGVPLEEPNESKSDEESAGAVAASAA